MKILDALGQKLKKVELFKHIIKHQWFLARYVCYFVVLFLIVFYIKNTIYFTIIFNIMMV